LAIDERILSVKSWRFDRIDEQSFIKTADVGDILLFRGRKLASKITRSFTHSKFDHVGIILKFEAEKSEVFFIDATAAGVSVNRWSRFRLFKDEIYKHIFFRHLYCERDDVFLYDLE